MKNFYDEKYKEKLISEIKKNINHFKIKSENENAICFYPYNSRNVNDNKNKLIIKAVISIWIITVLSLTTKYIAAKSAFDININYVLIFFLIIVMLLFKSVYSTKQIHKMILCDNCLKLYAAPIIKQDTKKHLKESIYSLSDIDFYVRDRNSAVESNTRKKSTNFYLICGREKKKFFIKFTCEAEFFSFLLILKDKIGKLNINDITDNELYNMYHTKSYGLKPPSIGGISM